MEKSAFESTQNFFDQWVKIYEATYGRLFETPAVGPIREKQEKVMKSFPIYVNLYTTWIESNINFQTVFMEAMRKTYEKTANEMMTGKVSPEEYKDFYKILIDTYSETFKEFIKSGHFANDMGKLMSNFIEFQKNNREILEENCMKPMNIPTKTDIDEINKELYSLKKTIKEQQHLSRDMEIQIKELSEKLDKFERSEKETKESQKDDTKESRNDETKESRKDETR